jgi:O-antigen/teichoic acid export membrane protein
MIARTDIELYGLYSLAFSIITSIIPFIVLGLNTGLLRYISFYNGKNYKQKSDIAVSSALKIVFFLSVFIFLILFLFSDFISKFFIADKLSLALKLFSPLIIILPLSAVLSSVLISNKKIKEFVLSKNIIQSIIELGILLIGIYYALRISGIASALLISNLVMILIMCNYSRRLFNFKKGYDKSLISFSLSAFLIFIISDLMSKIDTIILSHFADIKEVALYNVATPTAQTILIVSTALLTVFLPTIAEKHAQKQSIKTEYKKISHWILISSIPLTILLIFFSSKFIELFFGAKYLAASFPLSILAFSMLIFNLSRPAFNVLLMLQKTKILLKISIFVILSDIILNLLMIPLTINNLGLGIYGASIATSISFILLSVLIIFYARKNTKIPILDKKSFKIVLSAFLAALPLIVIKSLVSNQNLIEVITYLFLFGIIYLLLLFKLKCFDKEDKKIYLTIKEKYLKNYHIPKTLLNLFQETY